jgi:hypothetical protein
MLKFSKIISSKSKIYIVKENSGYFRNIPFVEMNVSKLINYYSTGHVLKWPRYYGI